MLDYALDILLRGRLRESTLNFGETSCIRSVTLSADLEPKVPCFPNELALRGVGAITLMTGRAKGRCVLDDIGTAFCLGNDVVDLDS